MRFVINQMTTVLISSQECNKHINPIGHPEQVDRLKVIKKALNSEAFNKLKKLDAKIESFEYILTLHSKNYLNYVRKNCGGIEQNFLDADTVVNRNSLMAALYGVGAVKQGIDLVTNGDVTNVFCATRPPGHHAEVDRAMGFCIFGNVALGAKYALGKKGIKKVAVFDFDVHHGNGTQNLIWGEKNILFISSHQTPLFPGTGKAEEVGAFNNILNIPLAAGSDGEQYHKIMDNMILPRIENFQPDIILLSAGFDAHKDDPLANLNWVSSDYYTITKKICRAARLLCKKRLVSSLEGGYNLEALGESVSFHVKALMEAVNDK